MLPYLQNSLLPALVFSGFLLLCGSAPAPAPRPHQPWLPLAEWPSSEPAIATSWDYVGLGNAAYSYPRQDSQEAWLPAPVAPPTIEVVRLRKPSVEQPPQQGQWTQIPVISGDRSSSRGLVALVPRGFEDYVLVRKPFVIVEEDDEPAKKRKEPKKKKSQKGRERPEEPDDSEDDEEEDNADESEDETTKAPEKPMRRSSRPPKMRTSKTRAPTSTMRTTTASSSSTSTTPAPAEDDDTAKMDDEKEPQSNDDNAKKN